MLPLFHQYISEASNQRTLFLHCTQTLQLPGDFTDLLRAEVVSSLSAFDKLIHDLITHYSVEIIAGRRLSTPKFDSEPITLSQAESMRASGGLPIDAVFEGIIRHKLSALCFMDPDKLADGLGLIWSENHKWQRIGTTLGQDGQVLRIQLKNIYKRRNSIVHEADYDHVGGSKLSISEVDSAGISNFILSLGNAIELLVR